MVFYYIRKYQESDRKRVLGLFFQGMVEYVFVIFRYILKLSLIFVFLFGGFFVVFSVFGFWFLVFVVSFIFFIVLWFFVKYFWNQFLVKVLQIDLFDIIKYYFSECGFCFWVVEFEGQVVGTVGVLFVEEFTLQKKQVELFRLSVVLEYRGQGIAKVLVRIVFQFVRDQGYSEVVFNIIIMQFFVLVIYYSMGFQEIYQFFVFQSFRLMVISLIYFIYYLFFVQVFFVSGQGGGF